MSRVFVTGGAGFVGGPLSNRLKALGREVLVYDNFFNGKREYVEGLNVVEGDVRDGDLLKKTLGDFSPDGVFHLAAHHFIPFCNAHPVETIDVNTRGTATLLNALREVEVDRVVSISTAAVYPISGDAHREDDTPGPMDIYGVSKLNTEELLKLYHLQTSRAAVNVRLFNVYGFGDTNPHVLPDILEQIPKGDTIELGNVAPKRDYTYTGDVVEGLIALMEFDMGNGYECFNLGTGEEHSVTELVEKIADILERKLTVRSHYSRKRKTERMHLLADIRKIKQKTGWAPRYNLRRGLEETLRAEGLLR